MTKISVALLCAAGATGCASSNYRPAESPRVTRVYAGGGVTYFKDGKEYDDLRDAVQDNPRALAEAREYRSLLAWANGVGLGGGAAQVGGFTLIAAGRTDQVRGAGVVTVLLGVGAEIAFFVIGAQAVPHSEDAINIYNDTAARAGDASSKKVAPAAHAAPVLGDPVAR